VNWRFNRVSDSRLGLTWAMFSTKIVRSNCSPAIMYGVGCKHAFKGSQARGGNLEGALLSLVLSFGMMLYDAYCISCHHPIALNDSVPEVLTRFNTNIYQLKTREAGFFPPDFSVNFQEGVQPRPGYLHGPILLLPRGWTSSFVV
jgi:hypothetical protein